MPNCRVKECLEPIYGSIPMKKFLKLDNQPVFFNGKLVIIDIEPWYYCSMHYDMSWMVNKMIDKFVEGVEYEIIPLLSGGNVNGCFD